MSSLNHIQTLINNNNSIVAQLEAALVQMKTHNEHMQHWLQQAASEAFQQVPAPVDFTPAPQAPSIPTPPVAAKPAIQLPQVQLPATPAKPPVAATAPKIPTPPAKPAITPAAPAVPQRQTIQLPVAQAAAPPAPVAEIKSGRGRKGQGHYDALLNAAFQEAIKTQNPQAFHSVFASLSEDEGKRNDRYSKWYATAITPSDANTQGWMAWILA